MASRDGLLDIDDLMRLFKCSRATVYRMVKKGIIPSPDDIDGLGKRWWKDDIEDFLGEQRRKNRHPKSQNEKNS